MMGYLLIFSLGVIIGVILTCVLTVVKKEIPNDGWILCSEMLPKHDVHAEYYPSVNVTLDDGRVAEGCYRNLDEEWWVDAPSGAHFSMNMTGHVIAWQPLPKPFPIDKYYSAVPTERHKYDYIDSSEFLLTSEESDDGLYASCEEPPSQHRYDYTIDGIKDVGDRNEWIR